MITIKMRSEFDVCQLPEKVLNHFFSFFINRDLANYRKVSRLWNTIIEPYIHHQLLKLSFSISSRCVIPAPFFSLGPMYHLKLAEILDPKCCFSVCVQTYNGFTINFKILKMTYTSNYQLAKSLIPRFTQMFNKIALIHQSAVLEYLDEFTLITKASRVSKAWMLKVQDYSVNWRDQFISLGRGEEIFYKRRSYIVKLTRFSHRHAGCVVRIKRNGFHAGYRLTPPSNVRLIDFFGITFPELMLEVISDEDRWKAEQRRKGQEEEKAEKVCTRGMK